MARALAGGFVGARLASGADLLAADPSADARNAFSSAAPGATTFADNKQVVAAADVIFLAVKPQYIDAAMADAKTLSDGKLFVSIAAGIPLKRLTAGLGSERVIRVMPNTPCLVGSCAAGFSLGAGATSEDETLLSQLLESVGVAVKVEERLLDAVTGLSGSGPAYAYVFLEALADGGVQMGLPRDVALRLAAQTLLGAARMVLETGEHPAVLKDRVASPGGTTIAGLQALEDGGLRSAAIAAVKQATLRSQELGK